MICKARNKAINVCDGFSLITFETKNKAKDQTAKVKRLKALTQKQLLQRLSIGLAQANASYNFETLLN